MATKDTPAKSEWDELPEPVAMPNTQGNTNTPVDVLAIVPEPIRVRAEANLAINTKRVAAKADSGAGRPRVDYHWEVQRVSDEAQGKRFAEFLVKYAKYRPDTKELPHRHADSPIGQVTARPQAPAWYRLTIDGKPIATTADAEGAYLGVRYSVRPFEQGKGANRLPGTA